MADMNLTCQTPTPSSQGRMTIWEVTSNHLRQYVTPHLGPVITFSDRDDP